MIQLPKQLVNVALNCGGLGDNVARLPAIKYCLDTYPHVSFEVWSPDYFLDLARHLMKGYESRCQFISVSRAPLLMDQSLMSVAFKNDFHTTMRTHLVHHAFTIMNDDLPPAPEHYNYLQIRPSEIDSTVRITHDNYVCLTPGYTAIVRALLPAAWNQIAKWLVGRGITPVWLGNEATVVNDMGVAIRAQLDEEIDFTVGIDLRNKTTLLEAAVIMSNSRCVVGLDNGLIHLSGCTNAKIVVGYTTVNPRARLPYRENQLGWNCWIVEQEMDLKCRYCQSNFHYLYNFDFRNCFTDTLDCVKQLTANKFITQLELALA